MYSYARLPTLVLNEIFGYLSVKQRIKCKAVCRSWKEEIELREKKRDTLVLHLGPYLRNLRWSHTNNRGLMKFENSFEVKHLNSLKHRLTRLLLKKIKKLALVNFHRYFFNVGLDISTFEPCFRYFDQCEEIEIQNFEFRDTPLTLDLPKVKVLMMKDSQFERLILKCPSLEVLYWNWQVEEISFLNVKNLKRLTCYRWPTRVRVNGKFESLEYLNLFTASGERVNDHLLEMMPKLKRLVLYSSNPRSDLERIRQQQERYGLTNLEILFSGFREPVEIALEGNATGTVRIDLGVDKLFDNYLKLVENSPWKVWVDYSKLFSKFKILPGDFFERFSEPAVIEIDKVANYTHLFEFLRCYPIVEKLKVHFSKLRANFILDQAHLLLPSLRELTIVEEHPSDVLKIDLSFMRLLDLTDITLKSTRLPVNFIRKVVAKRGKCFSVLNFEEIRTRHTIVIYVFPMGIFYEDVTCPDGPKDCKFFTVRQLIAGMQSEPHIATFLYE